VSLDGLVADHKVPGDLLVLGVIMFLARDA
jgi:hypothetical protein